MQQLKLCLGAFLYSFALPFCKIAHYFYSSFVLEGFGVMKGRLRREDRLFFTEQIALLLAAGVSIIPALELLINSAKKRSLRDFLIILKEGVKAGSSISSVLIRCKSSFSTLYIALVEVGEVSGKLPEMFSYLGAIERDRLSALKSIRKALMYPMIVIVVAIGVLLFILIAVVPTFEMLYQSSGVELPIITQRVLAFSRFLLSKRGGWVLIYLILFIVSMRIVLRRSDYLRNQIDRKILKIPMVGELLLTSFNAGFSQVVGVMLASGIPLVKAIQLYEMGVANTHVKQQLVSLRAALERGDSFYSVAKTQNIFSDVALTLISVGEVSGKLVAVLDRSGSYHADIVTQKVDAFIALIDPLSLLFIGGIVGVILVALYLPMFSMGMAI